MHATAYSIANENQFLVMTVCCRIASCVILKLFLIWVIGNYASGNSEYPVWKGWAIAAGLGGTGYVMTLLHHQIFWYALPLSGSEHSWVLAVQ